MGKKPHPLNHQIIDAKSLITISSLALLTTLPGALFGVYTMARQVNDFLPEDEKERQFPSIWGSLDPDDPFDDDMTDDVDDYDYDSDSDVDSDFEEEEEE